MHPAERDASMRLSDVAINVSVEEERGDKSHAPGPLSDSTIRCKTPPSVVNYV